MTNPEQERWTPENILEAGRTFWLSRPILAAAELGFFAALAEKPGTTESLTERLNTNPRATGMLLDALAALRLLDKANGSYSVPEGLVPFLSEDSEETILPMLRHHSHIFRRWAELPDVVRTGKPAKTPDEERPLHEMKAFIGAMDVVGRMQAAKTVARVDTNGRRRILDVGGASGTYTIAFLRRNPDMRGTIFDLPLVIDLARERLSEEGFRDRVDLVPGNFYEDPLPGGYDLVLISAIIHQNSREQNRDLYRKAYEALEPGGKIVVRDHVMDESRTTPVGGALFAINMLVATPGGGTYTFDEIREDLESAGFGNVRQLEEDERMNGLVEATR
jgi:predicted O-methyltransferase YrrM